MMPRKLTMENVKGTARSCGMPAAEGRLARDAKSGALLWGDAHAYIQSAKRERQEESSRRGGGGGETYVTSVAMLLMQDIRLDTIAQLRSLPCNAEGWWMIGPTPLARTMHQTKNVIPAVGATTALRVKRCRLNVASCQSPMWTAHW